MKIQRMIWLLPLVLFTACNISSYDNYDAPKTTLSGVFHYQGDSVRVSYDNVTFELWQGGFGAASPINVTVGQNGSYSAVLFEGDYRLVIPPGQGPFIGSGIGEGGSDTLAVQLQGDQQLDIEVTPYFMIRNPQFSVTGRTVSVNLAVEQIVTGSDARNIENVTLYISQTEYVDGRTSISSSGVNGADITDPSDISLTTDVPGMTPTQGYAFARVGVKIANVEDMIFSPVAKVQLN